MNKIIAVVLAVVLFFVLGSYAVMPYTEIAQAVQHPYAASLVEYDGYARSLLEEPHQQLYDTLKQGLIEEETEILSRRLGYTEEDVRLVLWAVKQDSPEIFWVDFTSWEFSQKDNGFTIRPTYTVTGADRQQHEQQLEEACDAIVAAAAEAGAETDFAKVQFVHDYIVNNTGYLEEGPFFIHTAYGALVDKTAVCDGYAHAFQLLLQRMDVECFYIEGYTTTSPPDVGHAWNMVNIDGKYYLVDTTWDDVDLTSDESWEGTAVLSYRFFLLSTEEMAVTHIDESPIEMPHCERYGYYVELGLSSSSLTTIRANVIGSAAHNAQNGKYYIEFELTDPSGFDYLKEHKDTELSYIINNTNDTLETAGSDIQFKNVLMRGDATLDGYIITLYFNSED